MHFVFGLTRENADGGTPVHQPPLEGVVGAPHQCPREVGSKLPLPRHADGAHVPMTHNTDAGQVMTYEGMLQDVKPMKKMNINAVRTSYGRSIDVTSRGR